MRSAPTTLGKEVLLLCIFLATLVHLVCSENEGEVIMYGDARFSNTVYNLAVSRTMVMISSVDRETHYVQAFRLPSFSSMGRETLLDEEVIGIAMPNDALEGVVVTKNEAEDLIRLSLYGYSSSRLIHQVIFENITASDYTQFPKAIEFGGDWLLISAVKDGDTKPTVLVYERVEVDGEATFVKTSEISCSTAGANCGPSGAIESLGVIDWLDDINPLFVLGVPNTNRVLACSSTSGIAASATCYDELTFHAPASAPIDAKYGTSISVSRGHRALLVSSLNTSTSYQYLIPDVLSPSNTTAAQAEPECEYEGSTAIRSLLVDSPLSDDVDLFYVAGGVPANSQIMLYTLKIDNSGDSGDGEGEGESGESDPTPVNKRCGEYTASLEASRDPSKLPQYGAKVELANEYIFGSGPNGQLVYITSYCLPGHYRDSGATPRLCYDCGCTSPGGFGFEDSCECFQSFFFQEHWIFIIAAGIVGSVFLWVFLRRILVSLYVGIVAGVLSIFNHIPFMRGVFTDTIYRVEQQAAQIEALRFGSNRESARRGVEVEIIDSKKGNRTVMIGSNVRNRRPAATPEEGTTPVDTPANTTTTTTTTTTAETAEPSNVDTQPAAAAMDSGDVDEELRVQVENALRQAGVESVEMYRTCRKCREREVGTVFLKCGHRVYCEQCAENVHSCPVCGSEIEKAVKTFSV